MTDGPSNPVLHKQLHPSLQLLLLIILTFFMLIIGLSISKFIIIHSYGANTFNSIMDPNNLANQSESVLWIFQLTTTTLPLLITPLFFSYIIMREPDQYLKTSFNFPWVLIAVVFFIMLFSNPLMEFIGNVNQAINLPQWMIEQEKQLQEASDDMLQMNSIWAMLFDLFLIGFLTAVAEEFLFRGCMQTIFTRWMKNKHAAIWTTAILFSAFHMEFFGFLPRLLLGVFFGYFVAWSGSVWTSVWAHFVNNGAVVIITYLFQHKLSNINPDANHNFTYVGYIISFIITLFLLFIYRYISNKRQLAEIHGEELG